jgi:hypothetical protein
LPEVPPPYGRARNRRIAITILSEETAGTEVGAIFAANGMR